MTCTCAQPPISTPPGVLTARLTFTQTFALAHFSAANLRARVRAASGGGAESQPLLKLPSLIRK